MTKTRHNASAALPQFDVTLLALAAVSGDEPERVIEPPLSEDDIRALQLRNRERVRRAIEQMGTLYCCHPAHAPQRRALEGLPC